MFAPALLCAPEPAVSGAAHSVNLTGGIGKVGAQVTREVAGRLLPGCFRSSLSRPFSSEAGTGALVQPQGSPRGALGDVPSGAPVFSFWGVERCGVPGGLVPRGPGSCVGRSSAPAVGSPASGGDSGLPGEENGGGEARPGSGLVSGPTALLEQDSQHSRWKPGMEQ